jgi:uncharacterized membrane protein YcgQ (UPF0703/DUF1980 family)
MKKIKPSLEGIKGILHKKHNSGGDLHPDTGWKNLIYFFVFLNILLVSVHVYFFLKVNAGELYSVKGNQELQVRTIDRTLLSKTIHNFTLKEQRLRELKVERVEIVDPSL